MNTDTLVVTRESPKTGDTDMSEKNSATQQDGEEVTADKRCLLMWWQNHLQSLLLSDLCLSVYPEDIVLANQQSTLNDRASQLSGVILKLILAQNGIEVEGPCVISGNLVNYERQDNEIEYSIIDPATVDCFLETLVVLIGQPARSQSIATGDQVVEALRLWLKRRERLEKWIDKEDKRVAQIA
ncbi:hypothetical protein E1B28_006181 [Marasmius oreades]|uniref:Uncharacterized protein n=1 Tax=Marasmius oreades TaxID=181124 RepID=A0A9P7UV07_9AGAR|nr:uncharacterized protein E1B28_006181 [Marasmius oreades]KAG7095432.1 hypothetical protein E1B28_006181 [Marasmius oreades]